MKILVGCEESQNVCKEFRKLGHEAYSCDILNTSGENPEWHFRMYVEDLFNGGFFTTQAGSTVYINKWDMFICFPPCTYLCNGAQSNITRRPHLRILEKREQIGIPFFMQIVNAPIEKIGIENPIGVMSTRYRKPDQIIRPWMFGHEYNKDVCLWLKGLPKLQPTKIIPGPYKKLDFWSNKRDDPANGSCKKSKTFPGIAAAMAEQWGGDIRGQGAVGFF